MITYSLSNRQRKELLVRGIPLQIAIPIGPDDVDAIEFARASLPEDAEWIVAAEIDELCIVANRSTGLASQLGQIVDYHYALQMPALPMFVNVVLARLSPTKPRGEAMQPQWPGRGFINGVEVIRFEKSEI